MTILPKNVTGYLIKDNGWWAVKFTPKHPEYNNIMLLFGNDTLPTSFSINIGASQVLSAIDYDNIGVSF